MYSAVVILILSAIVLVWAADRVVWGGAQLALICRIPSVLVGVVLVGLGTSLPEILVSYVAALHGKAALALGNALGSYIINSGLVLGVAALVRPLLVHSQLLKREFPLLVFALALVSWLLRDGILGRCDGWVMIFVGGIILLSLMLLAWFSRSEADPMLLEALPEKKENLWKPWFFLILGVVLLWLSSQSLVFSASIIARAMGVSDLMIGLTVVALGTSLPELAASVVASVRNEPDMAVGNVIGSNLFGVLWVTAMPGILAPGPVDVKVLTRDLPMMAVMTLLIVLFCFIGKRLSISRFKGGLLILACLSYVLWLVPF